MQRSSNSLNADRVLPELYLRADGDSRMGHGHLFRMLALTEMLKPHFRITFITTNKEEYIHGLFKTSGAAVRVVGEYLSYSEEFLSWSADLSATSIIVCDGYQFDATAQQALYDKGFRIVVIDDPQNGQFYARAIINPSGGVDPAMYNTPAGTAVYTGIAYAFLRPEFLQLARLRKSPVDFETAKKVFVCLGGADPENYTEEVLLNLVNHPNVETINLVTGSAFLHKNSLSAVMSEFPGRINHYNKLSAAELASLMRENDAAVCSASTVCYEYLCCGFNLFILQTALNQENSFNFLLKEQLAIDFRYFGSDTKPDIGKITESFDGCQDQRIVDVFLKLATTDL